MLYKNTYNFEDFMNNKIWIVLESEEDIGAFRLLKERYGMKWSTGTTCSKGELYVGKCYHAEGEETIACWGYPDDHDREFRRIIPMSLINSSKMPCAIDIDKVIDF